MSAPPTRFPLAWPIGWKRTTSRSRAVFKRFSRGDPSQVERFRSLTLNDTTGMLEAELRRLGARDEVLSTNVALRLDGLPRGGQAEPADPGVAIYFELDGNPVVLACDKWDRVADNVRAIAKHVEALRGQERWGVGTIEQAFRGYAALPANVPARPWHEILGVNPHSHPDAIKAAWKRRVKETHPDLGGDPRSFSEVNEAWAEFERLDGVSS